METATTTVPITTTAAVPRIEFRKYHCKLCKKSGIVSEHNGRADLLKHYRDVHPEHKAYVKSPKTATEPSSSPAMDRLLDAKKEILGALKDMEAERDVHHNRIRELDDQIAKYSKLI